jgi:DNA-binding NarL/FixJ family response regulator
MSDDDRRCLVVDGHALVRMGAREVLQRRFEVEEAAGLEEALDAHTDTGAFDVAVVELEPAQRAKGKPSGPAMIRALKRAMPATAIVAHATRPDRHTASEALEAGACAFVAKSSDPVALERAVEAAAAADRYVDPATPVNGNGSSALTRRQREILQLLADGAATDGAAKRLGLSAETVRTHTKAALARLGARDRGHAIAIALRAGLIE